MGEGVRQSGMIESKIADMDNEREQEIGILAVKGLRKSKTITTDGLAK
ncbi:MAG: hypothetical protein JRH08_13120 [Deltaproteobacteria bacterium]|nr:hypothetical protein [Deltaproteobacteria bacterium]MBW1930992.1 hypothetical protein [Deltaproteobacteria bacterium]MBW2026468.1 hypothetical protein [Deltaproteobacteria bacterium]MBW2126603.1 hypothetical protein [Deltaproteobacteria bacterium]